MARTYQFGDSGTVGIVLGLSARQVAPVAVGIVWLALCAQGGAILLGVAGPALGLVVAFGRWRGAPLVEIAVPATRLWIRRRRGRTAWARHCLLGAGPGPDLELPAAMAGLHLLEARTTAPVGAPAAMAVVHDTKAGTVSAVVAARGRGFPVTPLEGQDQLLDGWGSALTPLAGHRCPVVRVVWQEWAHAVGVSSHREFLATLPTRDAADAAVRDYETLLDQQAPHTVAHEVLLTVTVELRRVRHRRTVDPLTAAIDALGDEVRLFCDRLEAAGLTVDGALTPAEAATAVRVRSDPCPARINQVSTLARSLAAATGRGTIEWGPMAVEPAWGHVRVDGSWHRSYRVASWPMLPVGADWLGQLLGGAESATRTVTVVLEPLPIGKAAAAANRQITSLEADALEKERRGFRVTARERRRLADVEAREQELSAGHAEFHFAGIVTVTAPDVDTLDDACATVEQAAAQSLLDLRPLDARHDRAFVASLPLGRNLHLGRWR